MNAKSQRLSKVVKVNRNTFERFLKSVDVQFWNVDDFRELGELEMVGVNAEEIFFKLGFYYPEDDQPYVYVSSDGDLWDDNDPTSWDMVPTVTVEELGQYTYPSGGNDYLYFSFHSDEAINGNYLTLLINDSDPTNEDVFPY